MTTSLPRHVTVFRRKYRRFSSRLSFGDIFARRVTTRKISLKVYALCRRGIQERARPDGEGLIVCARSVFTASIHLRPRANIRFFAVTHTARGIAFFFSRNFTSAAKTYTNARRRINSPCSQMRVPQRFVNSRSSFPPSSGFFASGVRRCSWNGNVSRSANSCCDDEFTFDLPCRLLAATREGL